MAPMIPAERICISCEKEDGKYKCTKCARCSLPCSKAHREIHDNEPQPPSAGESGNAADSSGQGDDEPEGGHSPLTKLFKKYPNLQQQLRAIADATDPPPKDDKSGSGRFNPARPQQQEAGAVDARDRHADGEGLREYCELFKHEMAQKAEQGEDPDAAFRRRAAEHDAEVIRKLMEEEKMHKD
ncbi:hit finger domain protein [Apiospora kogelbergensis]|uniref:Hit finger domain protein n=1 Tax=Apiospora kogelbergensis TaxID=1337665 RepID=A0AAW0R6S7_9PEZI